MLYFDVRVFAEIHATCSVLKIKIGPNFRSVGGQVRGLAFVPDAVAKPAADQRRGARPSLTYLYPVELVEHGGVLLQVQRLQPLQHVHVRLRPFKWHLLPGQGIDRGEFEIPYDTCGRKESVSPVTLTLSERRRSHQSTNVTHSGGDPLTNILIASR